MAFEGTLQDFTVNMHGPELEYSSIEVQQGDTASRQVRIHLKDFGGADFQIPYGATAVFCINKADGHKVYDACEIEDESTVIVTLSNQAIACAGRQKAQIYITKDGWDIKTQVFTVNAPRAVYTDDAVKSSDEFGILSKLIAEYEAIVDSAGQSAVSAADSAAAAEAARQGIEESLGQISENKDNIAELKSDLSNKITKFYASNLGKTNLSDSDNGKIQDMIIYGKLSQDGVPTPENPVEIKSVVNPTVKVSNEDGTQFKTVTLPYTLNAIPVESGGNVTIDGQQYTADYVDVDKKQLVRMVDTLVFDGSELWELGSINDYNIANFVFHSSRRYKMQIASNRLPPQNSLIANTKSEGIYVNENYLLFIRLKTDRISTTDALKTWLSENNIVALTALYTPTTIDLTDEEFLAFKALTTHYPTTSVNVTSDQLDGYTTFNYPLNMKNGWDYIKEQLGDTREYIYDMELQSAEAYVNSEYAVTLTELEV